MKRVQIGADRAAYDAATDTLFVSLGDYDPMLIDSEEEIAPDVYLQYAWPSGDPAFMEVWHFSRHFGSFPAPVVVEIPNGILVEISEDTPAFA